MPKLSRTSSSSSHSYGAAMPVTMPSANGLNYYHGRVPSITETSYYDQMQGAPSPVTLGGGQGPTGYTDAYAVGPLTMPPAVDGVSASLVRSARMARANGGGVENGLVDHGLPDSAVSAAGPGQGGGVSGVSGVSSVAVPSAPVAHTVQYPRSSSGAWSPQNDEDLIHARARGENWAQIQLQFPGKTANACRKRHERLMERRNADDVDKRRMEYIAREYMNLRREIWAPLAQRTGEKWTVVEQKCMASGLKNLQGASRAAARRERLKADYVLVGGGGSGGGGGGGGSSSASGSYGSHGSRGSRASNGSNSYDDESGGASSGHDISPHDDGSASPGGGGNNMTHDGSFYSTGLDTSMSSTVTLASVPPPLRRPTAASRQHRHSRTVSSASFVPPPTPQHLLPQLHIPNVAGAPPVQDVVSPAYPEYYSTPSGFSQSLRSLGMDRQQQQQQQQQRHQQEQVGHQHHPSMDQYLSPSSGRLPPDMGIESVVNRRL